MKLVGQASRRKTGDKDEGRCDFFREECTWEQIGKSVIKGIALRERPGKQQTDSIR